VTITIVKIKEEQLRNYKRTIKTTGYFISSFYVLGTAVNLLKMLIFIGLACTINKYFSFFDLIYKYYKVVKVQHGFGSFLKNISICGFDI